MLSPLWLEDLSYHRYIFLIAILTYSCFSLMCINYFNILLLPKSGASCRGWKSTYCQPSQYSRALGMPAPWFIHTQVARIYRVNSLLSQSVPIGRSKWLKFSSKYSEFTYYTFETPFRRGCKLLLLLEGNQPNLVVVQGGERGVWSISKSIDASSRRLAPMGGWWRDSRGWSRSKRLCLKRRSPLKEWRKIVL